MTLTRNLQLDVATSQSIVDDLNQTYEALDAAMAQAFRASANMIETGRRIGLDPKSGQKLFTDLAACTGAMIESRQNLVAAHHQAHRIRMRSTAARVQMAGCPWALGEENGEAVRVQLTAVA